MPPKPSSTEPRQHPALSPAASSDPGDLAAIARALSVMQADMALITRLVLPLCTRQLSRTEQARLAGVSPATITRREQRTARRLLAAGITIPTGRAIADHRRRHAA